MLKLKTHFAQVPLEIVRKIVEQQMELEKIASLPRADNKKKLEEIPLEPITAIR
jgi:hypothetical protein